jgi:hypothetical protein
LRAAVPTLDDVLAPHDTRRTYAVLRGLTSAGGGCPRFEHRMSEHWMSEHLLVDVGVAIDITGLESIAVEVFALLAHPHARPVKASKVRHSVVGFIGLPGSGPLLIYEGSRLALRRYPCKAGRVRTGGILEVSS